MPLPDRIAAVPNFVGKNFDEAPPGHRFQIYLKHWQGHRGQAFHPYKAATAAGQEEKKQFEQESRAVLAELCPLDVAGRQVLSALRTRQDGLLKAAGDRGYARRALSSAPFSTGLGNEHPIENGFAFLTPYGLPYLAGSGVKGVLRRAAEELVLEEDASGWTWLAIWWLFGFEGASGGLWEDEGKYSEAFARDLPGLSGSSHLRDFIKVVLSGQEQVRHLDENASGPQSFLERLRAEGPFRQSIHYRGALDFWDVFPAPKGDQLVVEIMTPHHGSYYRGDGTPHDAESPVPVSFLSVPAGSEFDFHVVCWVDRLPQVLRDGWRIKLDAAFDRAFEWIGFGAKTSVGYGAMAGTARGAADPVLARPGSIGAGPPRNLATRSPGDTALTRLGSFKEQEFGSLDGLVNQAKDHPDREAALRVLAERIKVLWGKDNKKRVRLIREKYSDLADYLT